MPTKKKSGYFESIRPKLKNIYLMKLNHKNRMLKDSKEYITSAKVWQNESSEKNQKYPIEFFHLSKNVLIFNLLRYPLLKPIGKLPVTVCLKSYDGLVLV